MFGNRQHRRACLPACTAACSCLQQELLPSPASTQKRCWVSLQSYLGIRTCFSPPGSWVQDLSPYYTPTFQSSLARNILCTEAVALLLAQGPCRGWWLQGLNLPPPW